MSGARLSLGPVGLRLWPAALVALLSLCLSGCPRTGAPGPGQADQPKPPPGSEKAGAVLDKVAGAVVRVEVTLHLSSGRQMLAGSGFVASDDGLVLTSAQAISALRADPDGGEEIATARIIEVVLHPGTDQESTVIASVVRENADLGLALLKLTPPPGESLRLADAGPADGATVFACGCVTGLGEVSVRPAAASGSQAIGGRELVQLDVPPDPGSAGGPVVGEDGSVLGLQTAAGADEQTGQLVIPAGVINAWLASSPASDPKPPKPGEAVRKLVEQAGLSHTGGEEGIFTVPFDNGVQVTVHQSGRYVRAFVALDRYDPQTGLRALAYNYYDPIGKLSVYTWQGEDRIIWESQVPMKYASAEYLKMMARMAATGVERWRDFLKGKEPQDWYDVYPGGDEDALTAELERTIIAAGATPERDGESFKIEQGEVTVWARVFRGMAWIHAFTGGMPGESKQEQLTNAEDCLRRNWQDPMGRLSVDEHNDLGWEMQAPVAMLTPQYLNEIVSNGALQISNIWTRYGHVPFNEETEE